MKGTSYGIHRDTIDRRSDQWRIRRQYRWSTAEKFSLGPVGNTIVGLIGGGVGEQILSATGLLPSGGGGIAAISVAQRWRRYPDGDCRCYQERHGQQSLNQPCNFQAS